MADLSLVEVNDTMKQRPRQLRLEVHEVDSKTEVLFYARFEVPFHVSKKNNRPIFRNPKTGRAFLGKSKRHRDGEDHLVHNLRRESVRFGLQRPITGDLWVCCLFEYPENTYFNKKGIKSKWVGDLVNLIQAPLDAMEKAEIYVNDSQVCSLDGSRRLISPDDKHYFSVRIFKFPFID